LYCSSLSGINAAAALFNLDSPSGTSSVYLTGTTGLAGTPDATLANPVRQKETNLGNLFCDAIQWFIKVSVCRGGVGKGGGRFAGRNLGSHARGQADWVVVKLAGGPTA
jgi:hypothetical protein